MYSSISSEDDGSYDYISPYEANAIRQREENKEMIRKLGLNKVIIYRFIFKWLTWINTKKKTITAKNAVKKRKSSVTK